MRCIILPKDLESLKKSEEIRRQVIAKYGEIPLSIWRIDFSKNKLVKTIPTTQNKVAEEKHKKWIEQGLYDPELYDRFKMSSKNVRGKNAGLSIFPYDLAERIIKFYSEPYEIILDPMCGHATRLTAAFYLKRNYIGYDVSKRFMEWNRKVLKELWANSLIKPDIAIVLKEKSSEFIDEPTDSIDMIFTSPPYWDLEYYGDEPEQLGWNKTYDEFLNGLKRVLMQCFRVLKPGRFCIWNINDFRKDGKFYTYHADVIRLAKYVGFEIHDIIIVDWGTSIFACFASEIEERKITAKSHEYLVVMKKPLKYYLVWDPKIYKPNREPCPKCGKMLTFSMTSETHESAKCECGYSITRRIKQDGVMPKEILEAIEKRKSKLKPEFEIIFLDEQKEDFEIQFLDENNERKSIAKVWECPRCGHVNDEEHYFFCEKCGFRNLETMD